MLDNLDAPDSTNEGQHTYIHGDGHRGDQPVLREVEGSGVNVEPLSRRRNNAFGAFATIVARLGSSSCKVQATPMLGMTLLYMLVSMSLTLADKWIITGLGFDAPLTLIMTTYFLMHLASTFMRRRWRRRGLLEGEGQLLVQHLTRTQWAWKVLPVAAASGLEVGTSALGLQVMHIGIHTMIRSTVPIFVLLFSVGLGLQEFRIGLLVIVFLVSAGVSLLFSGQRTDHANNFPMDGFLLTLLSGMLAGLKWTLSQVLLQGRGLCGRGDESGGDVIQPFTLLHYMSLSSAATLLPFALALELGSLREMAVTFGTARILKTAVMIAGASMLALILVLTEFTFIRKVSSLSLCIIGVVKELLLVLFSVGLLGEHLSGKTGLGLVVTMFGVIMYKLVPKGPPRVLYEAMSRSEEAGLPVTNTRIADPEDPFKVLLAAPETVPHRAKFDCQAQAKRVENP